MEICGSDGKEVKAICGGEKGGMEICGGGKGGMAIFVVEEVMEICGRMSNRMYEALAVTKEVKGASV